MAMLVVFKEIEERFMKKKHVITKDKQKDWKDTK